MLLRNYAKGNRRPKIAGYPFKVNKDAGHTASYRPIGAKNNWNIWSVFLIARWECFSTVFPISDVLFCSLFAGQTLSNKLVRLYIMTNGASLIEI